MTTETIAKAEFKFRSENHSYWLGSRRLEGVTEILKDNGLIDDRWFTEEARSRGSAVHLACALLDQGRGYKGLHPDLEGYVESYRKMKTRLPFIFRAIETPIYHSKLLYAGTPDRDIKFLTNGWDAVLDLKTGPEEPWHRYQSAAYEAMLPPLPERHRRRFSVHLFEDGKEARLVEHTDYSDFSVFTSLLIATRTRRKHNVPHN